MRLFYRDKPPMPSYWSYSLPLGSASLTFYLYVLTTATHWSNDVGNTIGFSILILVHVRTHFRPKKAQQFLHVNFIFFSVRFKPLSLMVRPIQKFFSSILLLTSRPVSFSRGGISNKSGCDLSCIWEEGHKVSDRWHCHHHCTCSCRASKR